MNIQQLRKQAEDSKTAAAVAEADYNRLAKQLKDMEIPDLKTAEKELLLIDKELLTLKAKSEALLKQAENLLNQEEVEE